MNSSKNTNNNSIKINLSRIADSTDSSTNGENFQSKHSGIKETIDGTNKDLIDPFYISEEIDDAEVSFKLRVDDTELKEMDDEHSEAETVAETVVDLPETILNGKKRSRSRSRSKSKERKDVKRSKGDDTSRARRSLGNSDENKESRRSLVDRCKTDPEIQSIVKSMVSEQINEQLKAQNNKGMFRKIVNENFSQNVDHIPHKVRSPSQSTLYTPAIKRSANLTRAGCENNTLNNDEIFGEVYDDEIGFEKSKTDDNITQNAFTIGDLDNALYNIRFNAGNRYDTGNENRQNRRNSAPVMQNTRTQEQPRPSTSRQGGGINDRPMDRSRHRLMSQARTAAQDAVIQAERFKASIQPKGIAFNNNKMPLAPHDRMELMHLRYLDDDDDFFHVSCHIDQALMQKIAHGEFVELEKLIQKKTALEPESEKRMHLVNRDGESFFVPTTDRETKITNVKKWEQAFRVYTTVYCKFNPERAAEILQYIDVINRAAQIFSWDNVARYDYVFRQLMAAKPYRSWAKTYTQMWNMTLNEPIKKFQDHGNHHGNHNNHNNTRFGKKDNTCWRYNKGTCKFGSKCRFEHKCSYCGTMNHPATNCHKKQNQRKQDGKASSSSSSSN